MASYRYVKYAVVVVIAGLVSLAGFSLWAAREETPSPPKDFVRMIAAYELQLHHWRLQETDPVQQSLAAQFASETKPALEYQWSTRFVSNATRPQASRKTSPSDEFEVAAVAAVEKEGDEVWQELPDGSFRYLTAVTMKESCAVCHIGGAAGPKAGEPLGYTSLTFTRRAR